MDRLKDKVAVITGAASGMGRGAAELFVAEGAKVIAADIQDEQGLELERKFNGQLKYVHTDVMKEPDIRAVMQTAVDTYGGLDIVFNNAGAGGKINTIETMTGEAWDFTMNLLLRSVALGITYAIPHLKARGGGSIVNTASIAGVQAGYGPTAYSVAKNGVIHLTRVAAIELGRSNIRVNAICPGLILTSIFTAAHRERGASQERMEEINERIRDNAPNVQPIPKAGLPADIAKACLFFASDDSEFVTGTHMIVDGGLTTGPRSAWDPDTPQTVLPRRRDIERLQARKEHDA